jgi:oxygen-independent coproporphyrinogen-3 oxidase
MSGTDQLTGIYIHVPFCLSKCRYCDFYSITQLNRITDYASGLLLEMAMICPDFPQPDTLYFGGGTPSLLPTRILAEIIERAVSYWGLSTDAEITMEMNPAAMTPKAMQTLKDLGINRLNIGVQSFSQENLSFLGRIHSAALALKMAASARQAGFDNLGIDMMFGLPGQTVSQWEKDLRQAVHLSPEHLSCYILSYEPGTPLFESMQSGRISRLHDHIVADQFRLTHTLLAASGYEHYEISNFAQNGFQSRHNRKYWNHTAYLGLGPAAHSYQHPLRWWNHRSLDHYLETIQKGRRPIQAKECLTETQQLIEALYLGLRQSDGIDLASIEKRFLHLFSEDFQAQLQQLIQQGRMVMEGGRWRLTLEGMLQSDHIIGQLIAGID